MFKSTISSLLQVESFYTLSFDYFKVIKCIDIEMRSTLLAWMLEVCEEEECTNEIFSHSVNLFDRFMSSLTSNSSSFSHIIDKSHLQLIGIACLLIASKVKSISSSQMNSIKLIEYTAHTFTLEELLQFELIILDALKWDVAVICPNDFLDLFFISDNQLISNLNQEQIKLLHKHSHAFTSLCSIDYSFAFYPPSMIASACFCAALDGILKLRQSNDIILTFVEMTQIDMDLFDHVLRQVKALFKQEFTSASIQEVCDVDISMRSENENKYTSSLESTQFNFSLLTPEASFLLEDVTNHEINLKSLSPSCKLKSGKFSSHVRQPFRKSMRRSGRARG